MVIHLQGGPAHGQVVSVDLKPGQVYRVYRTSPKWVDQLRVGEIKPEDFITIRTIEYKPVKRADGKAWVDGQGRPYYEP